jgi:hypothetical protein
MSVALSPVVSDLPPLDVSEVMLIVLVPSLELEVLSLEVGKSVDDRLIVLELLSDGFLLSEVAAEVFDPPPLEMLEVLEAALNPLLSRDNLVLELLL